ncbi:glycosyltransferase family 2 protein [Calycomorphotria hydatis]|uniref:Glycosyltransferase EpsH n=1 Tax=Calycomorphotria hydatis TaxID=2528027 RepID=A0A517T3E4_9PLAN|nr:glycosyltransferase family 2 protein [Calycomorphotria hydatis]QDT62890.1 Putative glycosyltransferase EpsH [Calycomorphotria hydatis]
MIADSQQSPTGSSPVISIIMPTYNRANFLPEAFNSIASQTISDWELIVVDDGSTDESPSIIEQWLDSAGLTAKLIRQQNKGAYAARATGLAQAKGEYIAFYDSDDLWLPHHLESCLDVLKKHDNVDWVWCADCAINLGDELPEDYKTLPASRLPERFQGLDSMQYGDLKIFNDDDLVYWILYDMLDCGLPTSLIRKRVFDMTLFRDDLTNGEDRFFLIRALKNGFTLARLQDLQYIYRVHEQNSSASARNPSFEHLLRVRSSIIKGYESLASEVQFTPKELDAWRNRLANECFWNLGYNTLWAHAKYNDAFKAFRRGISYQRRLSFLKTYLSCLLKRMFVREV